MNNNLLNHYYNFQKQNIPFQNNSLLQNNPNFNNYVKKLPRNMDRETWHRIQQNKKKLERFENMKKNNKFNNIDNYIDKKTLQNCVIKPITVNKLDKNEIRRRYDDLSKEFNPKLQKYWKERTNQPYKNILKNEDYKKKINKKEDLIVHKITNEDKIGLMNEFDNLKNTLEKHDDELKVIYSTSKENEHFKKFRYNNKYKFRMKYNPADFNKMKKDKIKYYQKEQNKIEENKKTVDSLIEAALNNNILSKEDVKKLDINNETNLEKELIEELGDEYKDLIKEAIEINNNETTNKRNDNQDIITKSGKKMTIKKTDNDNNNTINVTDDIKNKYKNRQKKI
jgi:hypothetical protein